MEYLDCASFFYCTNGSFDDSFAFGNCSNQTILVNCCNIVIGAGPNNFELVFAIAGCYFKLQCFACFQILCARWSKCVEWSWFYNCDVACECFAIYRCSNLCCTRCNGFYNAIFYCCYSWSITCPCYGNIFLWCNCYRQCFTFANFQLNGRFANSVSVLNRLCCYCNCALKLSFAYFCCDSCTTNSNCCNKTSFTYCCHVCIT